MTNMQAISVALGFALLMGTTAADEPPTPAGPPQPQILAGHWQCGVAESSRTGYQCNVISFQPAFGGTPRVFLSLSRLDLTASGTTVLASVEARVEKVSWNSFQPEVDATGWTDSSRSRHVEVHESGNWGGTWIAIGPPQRAPSSVHEH
jgi:hypothetical protein